LPDSLLSNTLNKLVNDREIDVGFKQRFAYLRHPLADVRFRNTPAASQLLESFAKTSLNAFEHVQSPAVRFGRIASSLEALIVSPTAGMCRTAAEGKWTGNSARLAEISQVF
jgi:hypothetical protein